MAHAQKPDSVFQRNGRVHLYWRGCQFSRVLAFLQCGSFENDCSNTGWTVPSQNEACLATHSIRLFSLHFSSRASPCATRFRLHSTKFYETRSPGWKVERDIYMAWDHKHAVLSVFFLLRVSSRLKERNAPSGLTVRLVSCYSHCFFAVNKFT